MSSPLSALRLRVLVLLMLSATAVLALTGTTFEGIDGNLIVDAGTDWQSFSSPALMIGTDLPTGQSDDSFKAAKEDEVGPQLDAGSVPSNKSDLVRFYLIHETLGSPSHDYLYLGWVRSNTLGTANMDFELNQSDTLSANGVTPVRTVGDMLITFDFSGGTAAGLGLSRWTETGPCEASPTTPCWGVVTPLQGAAEGAVNALPVFDPFGGVTLPGLTFGEAAIDLTAAGVFDPNSCTSFGKAYVKSRSSDSFSSSMKDFIRPIDVEVTNCATVTITKNAVPDDAQDFVFDASEGLAPATFMLDDDGNAGNQLPRSRTWSAPIEGAYSVAERPTAGWDLTDITCTGDAEATRDGDGNLTGEVILDLARGTNVGCTFTNTKRGRILVDEVTIPSADPQQFSFHLTGSVAQDFSLADASPMHDSGTLVPGSYSVLQDDPGLAWDPTSATCSDGSSPDNIQLGPGETVTCTFVNTKRGRILVDSVVTPSGDPTKFNFTLTGGPSALSQLFALADQDPAHDSGWVLPGSGYSAGRTLAAGYYDAGASCDNGSPVGNVSVNPGQTVLCTFSAVKGGRILVRKQTVPAGDPALFAFTLNGGPSGLSQSFILRHSDPAHDSGLVQPGAGYTVTESSSPDWDLTGMSCTSARGTSSVSFTGANADPGFQQGDTRVTVNLGIADDVTCTFTNTRRGSVIVVKDAVPNCPQDFGFTVSGSGIATGFLLDDDGDSVNDPGTGHLPSSRTFARLVPGSYQVSESDSGPTFDFRGVECSDSGGVVGSNGATSGTVTFTLDPGETVTCRFVNVMRGTVTVEKLVLNSPVPGFPIGPQDVLFDFNSSWGLPFILKHGQLTESPLLPGDSSQSVQELRPSYWETTSTCVYPDGSRINGGVSVNVTVPAGDTVHCTFYNKLVVHPGSSGFWRNWENHYTDPQLLAIMTEAFDESPIYSSMYLPSGVLVPNAITIYDGIYQTGGTDLDDKIMKELTTLMMNLAVSDSSDPNIAALQSNDDVCVDCIIDVSAIPGAQALVEEWSPGGVFANLVVGDILAVAEAVWSGDVAAGVWSFGPLTDAEKNTLATILEGINIGSILIPDPSTFPDRPGCLTLPGLPIATEMVYYSSTVSVLGSGTAFGEVVGELPAGLSLDPHTLEISGTPDPIGPVPVTYTFGLNVTLDGISGYRVFSITVNPWPDIITASCPEAVVDIPYAKQLLSSGGSDPLSWTIVAGSLPAGLALDPSSGMISGMPEAFSPLTATSNEFEVQVIDLNGASAIRTLGITVLPSGDMVCSPAPATPTGSPILSVDQSGANTFLFWTEVPGGDFYDVIQGDLGTLRISRGDFRVATSSCLASAIDATTFVTTGTPLPGKGVWFLVRPRNCGGTGTLDEGVASQLGTRDAEIEGSGKSCP